MKINGQQPVGPAEEVLVLPRANGDIVFTARAVMDMEEFHAQSPPPKAPGRLTKEGFQHNFDDPTYRKQVDHNAEMRLGYLVIRSLEATEIEWDTVDINKPETWTNWSKDLKEAGFNQNEIDRILITCMQANCLDEMKLKAARDAFLRGQGTLLARFSGQNCEL